MKKLLSINIGAKNFGDEYLKACRESSIETTPIRSRNCCLVLNNSEVALYHQNQLIVPVDYGFVFIRVAGNFTLMTSLIVQLFDFLQVSLSDRQYLQHTKNEEKITQMLQFTLAGLPIPKSLIFTIDGWQENLDTILSELSFPCVLKTNGSQGKNVWKIESQADLLERIGALEIRHEVAMVQEFIPNSYDIRAIYMAGDIIGAIKRSSTDGFYNNVSRGGSVEQIVLNPEEIDLVHQSCKVLGRSFAGVDIVRTENGPRLFEVNLGPQITGFERATNINVAAELIRRIGESSL